MLRKRATAIVSRDGMVLLVKDRGRDSFSLPGGGVQPGELPISAVARELHEETALEATSISYLFDHPGKHNTHHVFRVDAVGDVDVGPDADVVDFVWWDRNDGLSVFPHVSEILSRPELEQESRA